MHNFWNIFQILAHFEDVASRLSHAQLSVKPFWLYWV